MRSFVPRVSLWSNTTQASRPVWMPTRRRSAQKSKPKRTRRKRRSERVPMMLRMATTTRPRASLRLRLHHRRLHHRPPQPSSRLPMRTKRPPWPPWDLPGLAVQRSGEASDFISHHVNAFQRVRVTYKRTCTFTFHACPRRSLHEELIVCAPFYRCPTLPEFVSQIGEFRFLYCTLVRSSTAVADFGCRLALLLGRQSVRPAPELKHVLKPSLRLLELEFAHRALCEPLAQAPKESILRVHPPVALAHEHDRVWRGQLQERLHQRLKQVLVVQAVAEQNEIICAGRMLGRPFLLAAPCCGVQETKHGMHDASVNDVKE